MSQENYDQDWSLILQGIDLKPHAVAADKSQLIEAVWIICAGQFRLKNQPKLSRVKLTWNRQGMCTAKNHWEIESEMKKWDTLWIKLSPMAGDPSE